MGRHRKILVDYKGLPAYQLSWVSDEPVFGSVQTVQLTSNTNGVVSCSIPVNLLDDPANSPNGLSIRPFVIGGRNYYLDTDIRWEFQGSNVPVDRRSKNGVTDMSTWLTDTMRHMYGEAPNELPSRSDVLRAFSHKDHIILGKVGRVRAKMLSDLFVYFFILCSRRATVLPNLTKYCETFAGDKNDVFFQSFKGIGRTCAALEEAKAPTASAKKPSPEKLDTSQESKEIRAESSAKPLPEDWTFETLRHDDRFHLGLGDVRLTVAMQEELEARMRRGDLALELVLGMFDDISGALDELAR